MFPAGEELSARIGRRIFGDALDGIVRISSSRQRGGGANQPKVGWQQKGTKQTEHKLIRDEVWPGLNVSHRALFRSQH